MYSPASLRNFRKKSDNDKGSILRFIRRSPSENPKIIINNSSSIVSSSTSEKVQANSSQHPADNIFKIKGASKVVFIEPASSNDTPSKVSPKNERTNIATELKNRNDDCEEERSENHSSSNEISPGLNGEESHTIDKVSEGTNQLINSQNDSNVEEVTPRDGSDSDECDSLNENISRNSFSNNRIALKRSRIESDDDSSQEEPSSPPFKKAATDSIGLIKGMSEEMTEKLIDTYCDIYPLLDKMEIYDVMLKWDGNLVEVTKNLDTIQKEKSSKKSTVKIIVRKQVKKSPPVTKKQEVSSYRSQKEKRNQIFKLKGRAFQEEIEADEEDEYLGKSRVYVSDSSDEDCEEDKDENSKSQETNFARESVLKFYNEATLPELVSIPGCSKKKADVILQCRPFESWEDLVFKFKNERFISAEMLNSAKDLLYMRDIVKKLMKNCESIAQKIESLASEIADESDCKITKQPSILNPQLELKPYQLIGLNWLDLMHNQNLNGVLADEMGLGKTIQAISFLAHLKEIDDLDRLCLIVVPTSTLDNWAKELEKWCPSLTFLLYHGSQDERRGMRSDIMHSEEFIDATDVILTTYNMVTSSPEDRVLFRKLAFHTVIFDEAHMLKNMASQRYENLMKIRAERRVLLTGTPLQNNLVELMSLLIFVMPKMFQGKQEQLRKVFSMFPKTDSSENKGNYEKERIIEAKRIMKPFFLRRLKEDVLKDLPAKEEKINFVPMTIRQKQVYCDTVDFLNKRAQEIQKLDELRLQDLDELAELEESSQSHSKDKNSNDSSGNMLMTLRKIANHPLLVRNLYTSEKLEAITKILKKTTHKDSNHDYIVEDLSWMSDFEIHKTCLMYSSINHFSLSTDHLLNSGKFKYLDDLLPTMKENGDKVLIFSQFVIMLNILEEYLKINGHEFVRLDGSTPVAERQDKIEYFNETDGVFVFLLSTRAGGLGINLSSANNVILHDIDFNPYNDKQAEDRCHRVGQTRNVTVHRFMTKDTIEEGIFNCALQKLQLEKQVTNRGDTSDCEQDKKSDVLTILKTALGLSK